jgi:hypothetical protein
MRRELSACVLGAENYGVFPKAAVLCLILLQPHRCEIPYLAAWNLDRRSRRDQMRPKSKISCCQRNRPPKNAFALSRIVAAEHQRQQFGQDDKFCRDIIVT